MPSLAGLGGSPSRTPSVETLGLDILSVRDGAAVAVINDAFVAGTPYSGWVVLRGGPSH
jgi:hypothetical protein